MYLRFFTFLFCSILSLLTFGQGMTGNFVRTSRFLDGAGNHAVVNTTHFDGLGRPAAELRRTGSGEYAASLRQYDLAGRETRKWCEVPVADDVLPEADAFGTEAAAFYADARPFAETSYDALDRPVRFWREGQDWLSHPSASCRVTNMEGEVLRYYAAPGDTSLVLEGCFPAASLTGEERTDEDGHTIRSFYDRQGRMLLMRRADGAQTGGWCDTYYVYDVFGLLRFVLTPGYRESGSRELSAYEYRYDRLRRCVWKRMPGQGPVTYAYDAADRIILEQDPILRERGLRRFFVYDGLGRSVMQGTCRDGGTVVTRPGHHFMTADFCPEAEGMLGTGYVMVSACVELVEPSLEIVSYYDGYGFLQHGCLSAFAGHDDLRPNNAALATGINARGMKTGEMCVASDGTRRYRTFFYDGHGREVARHESMSSGKVCKTLTEYSLTGKTTCVTRLWPYVGVALPGHAASTLVYSLETEYGYDEWTDEIESVWVRVGCNGVAGEAVCVLANGYDALGRLASQTVPSTAGDIRGSFSYDLHGWRTGADHPLFSERLHYADGPDAARYCYNGNASAMQWRASDGVWRGYRLRYSDRDMLKGASYAAGEDMTAQTARYSETAPAFNADGAITHFVRYGRRTNGTYNYIDYLSFVYDGQRLRNVSDSYLPHLSYTGAFEYVDGHSGTAVPDFEYNAAGLLVMDRDRGISRISYTDFARPDSIVFASGAKTLYTYTPDGRKLAVRCLDAPTFSLLPTVGGGSAFGSTLYQTDYITDGLEITRVNGMAPGTVRFDFGSGYLTFTPGASAVSPQYFHCVRDHLGSVRSVWTYDAEGDSIREVQRTAYYPFGGIIPDLSTGRNVQRNLFCGKEYDTTSGLNLYDFGARLYDPAAPHFLSPDPLQESYYPWNAYAYCLNNPVKYVDPEGKAPGDFFFNMNEAAIDFAKIMNGTSIYLDRELYAQILSVNIRGKQGYTYSFPIKGNQHSVYGRKRLTNFKVVADIHTHGAYSAGYDDNHFSGEMITINQTERTKTSDELKTSYSLTDGDIAAANKNQYISYLVTPNGSLKKYNPMSGKLSIIKSDIPGDLKDPTSNHIKSTNSFDLDSAINILTYRIKMLRYEK